MKKLFVIAVVMLMVARAAFADQTLCYGWEDGGTILGFYYADSVHETNVSGIQTGLTGGVPPGTWTTTGAYEGDNYLHVAESPHSGTPQVNIAWITGLGLDDNVAVSYYGWDDVDRESTNGEPALRIWAHYSAGDDITAYAGSAGAGNNNSGYSHAPTGWQQISSDWTIPAEKEALVIEMRLYSYPTTEDPMHTDYWADWVCVTAPDGATIHFPEPVNPVEDSTWSAIKALYR